MKPLVIYHGDGCQDGFGAAFAAWKALGDGAEYVPMQYGQIKNVADMNSILSAHGIPKGRGEVFILDFSLPPDVMKWLINEVEFVVWLDHHKSAFEMWCDNGERKYYHCLLDDRAQHHITLDNDKSGALLAWEYFHPGTEVPLLIQHIDDRDRWQWKLDGSAEIHAALGLTKPWTFAQWDTLLTHVEQLKANGGVAILQVGQTVQQIAGHARKCRIPTHSPDALAVKELMESWDLREAQAMAEVAEMNPLIGLAVNSPVHQSEVGHELANASGTFGLVWYLGNDNKVRLSFRSNAPYDVSAIAKSLGGGGHAQAAGAECTVEQLLSWLR